MMSKTKEYWEGRKVYYRSPTGEKVTARIVGRNFHHFIYGDTFTLRSTSRRSKAYPTGFEWEVPVGASSVVAR